MDLRGYLLLLFVAELVAITIGGGDTTFPPPTPIEVERAAVWRWYVSYTRTALGIELLIRCWEAVANLLALTPTT